MANKLAAIVQSGTNNYLTPSLSANRISTDLIAPGVIGAIGTAGSGATTYAGSFAVNQQGSPNMTVAVSLGQAYVSATPTGGTAQTFAVTSDSTENVTIPANSSGSTVYNFIYIKLDPDKLNNPASTGLDVTTFITSTSTTQGVDSNTQPANTLLLAEVTTINNASSISASNITDRRVNAVPYVTGGWQLASETWTYASASTFTVASDVTNKYQVGDKLRLRQQGGAYKYFFIVAISFSAPNTTITVYGGSATTLANATIYDNSYSKKLNPQGFPAAMTGTNGGTGGGTTNFTMIGQLKYHWGQCAAITYPSATQTDKTIIVPVAFSGSTGPNSFVATGSNPTANVSVLFTTSPTAGTTQTITGYNTSTGNPTSQPSWIIIGT